MDGLTPQNTTKWVKNALRAKGGAGKDDRKAIAEQLKIGQELRAKVCMYDVKRCLCINAMLLRTARLGRKPRQECSKKGLAVRAVGRHASVGIPHQGNGKAVALLLRACMRGDWGGRHFSVPQETPFAYRLFRIECVTKLCEMERNSGIWRRKLLCCSR